MSQSKSLNDIFDCVIFLTWSDWYSEPRSNRYHYAVRFAKQLPVYFIQPKEGTLEITFDHIADQNITVISIPNIYLLSCEQDLWRKLQALGVRRPLVWAYNPKFIDLVKRMHPPFVAYHATEDYFGKSNTIEISYNSIREELKEILKVSDLLVAVSENVRRNYIELGGFAGQSLVAANGCDFEFWQSFEAHKFESSEEEKPQIIFQGAINQRLDFELVQSIVKLRPNYLFCFCGALSNAPKVWKQISKEANVKYLGFIEPEEIAKISRKSYVGIIPFVQEPIIKNSLPLKAFEYVACGMPVVTVPIDALSDYPELFVQAETPEEFVEAIDVALHTRSNPEMVESRLNVARLMSYDHRFKEVCQVISSVCGKKNFETRPANVLVLYDDNSTHVGTISEHLEAFRKYSQHRIYFAPATDNYSVRQRQFSEFELDPFDAVVIHYCVRLSLNWHLPLAMAKQIELYDGPKILFIQDEYENTETAREWIERLGITTIYTTVPLDEREKVYSSERFPDVEFLPTITGYVPEGVNLDSYVLPIEQRETRIGYRGRALPHQYGQLGYEKYIIGVKTKKFAEERGVPVDIEVDESKRIYGEGWYRFLASSRATLGTESGSNVFDDDGSLAALANEHRDMPFEQFAKQYIGDKEGEVIMNQVSPKIFEAIRLRTALVLFEGTYSGVVIPDRHFIPLKKDFSNIDDVFSKLENLDFLKELTDRAFREVILEGRYSYSKFIEEFDMDLNRKLNGPRYSRSQIVYVPLFICNRDRLNLIDAFNGLCSDVPLNANYFHNGVLSGQVLGANWGDSSNLKLISRIQFRYLMYGLIVKILKKIIPHPLQPTIYRLSQSIYGRLRSVWLAIFGQ